MMELESEEVFHSTEIRKNALIVYIVGDEPLYLFVESFITKNWNHVAKPEIFLYEEGYFVVKFKKEEDRDEIIYFGPYSMNNRSLILRVWSHDINFKEEFLRVLPLWVKFSNLPLNCLQSNSLS